MIVKYPFGIFLELLRRFPKLTHFFWRYLFALRPPSTPRQLRRTPARHLMLMLVIYIAASALGIWAKAVLFDVVSSLLA